MQLRLNEVATAGRGVRAAMKGRISAPAIEAGDARSVSRRGRNVERLDYDVAGELQIGLDVAVMPPISDEP